MKESPGLHLNVAGRTIAIQKKLLQAYDERMSEQKKWIELLARRVNALDKTYGAQYIWKLDHYQVGLSIVKIFFPTSVEIYVGTTGGSKSQQEDHSVKSTISHQSTRIPTGSLHLSMW